MRSKTPIHAGIRNIGDANDSGIFFEGTLQEGLMWLIESISKISVAKRVIFVIARNRDEVTAGLELRKGSTTRVSDNMMNQLRSMIGELDDDDDSDSTVVPLRSAMPDDDWKEA